jgi:hypothetical protein
MTNFRRNQQLALAALNFGRNTLGPDARPQDIIWWLLGQSKLYWELLPDREQRWLTAGTRAQSLDFMTSAQERWEVARDREADDIEDAPVQVRAPGKFANYAEAVSEWFRFLKPTRDVRFRAIVSEVVELTAHGWSLASAAQMLSPKLQRPGEPETSKTLQSVPP